jgi:hypothetical protein
LGTLLWDTFFGKSSENILQFVLKSDSVIDTLKPPILTMTVNVWNRKKGDPSAVKAGSGPFKGKFPEGTFVFPFEFPALPNDTVVKHPDEERRKVSRSFTRCLR